MLVNYDHTELTINGSTAVLQLQPEGLGIHSWEKLLIQIYLLYYLCRVAPQPVAHTPFFGQMFIEFR